jgi:four helix bundle protein
MSHLPGMRRDYISDCRFQISMTPTCNAELLKDRTKRFALQVIRLCRALPRSQEATVISRQLPRSSTSVGANYRAVCRARSTADSVSKLGIVLEEADETLF